MVWGLGFGIFIGLFIILLCTGFEKDSFGFYPKDTTPLFLNLLLTGIATFFFIYIIFGYKNSDGKTIYEHYKELKYHELPEEVSNERLLEELKAQNELLRELLHQSNKKTDEKEALQFEGKENGAEAQ